MPKEIVEEVEKPAPKFHLDFGLEVEKAKADKFILPEDY
jgi:hypothetical protein